MGTSEKTHKKLGKRPLQLVRFVFPMCNVPEKLLLSNFDLFTSIYTPGVDYYIIYEKTKGQIFLRRSLGKQNIQAKEVYWKCATLAWLFPWVLHDCLGRRPRLPCYSESKLSLATSYDHFFRISEVELVAYESGRKESFDCIFKFTIFAFSIMHLVYPQDFA